MSSSPQCIVQLVHQGSSVFFYTKIVTARPAFYRSAGLPRSRALLRRQFETTEPASLSAVNRLQRYQVPPTKISALHRTAPFQNDPSCESSLKTQDPSICPRSDAASRRAYAADASSSAAESEGPPATSPDWTPGAGEEGMAAWARAERERAAVRQSARGQHGTSTPAAYYMDVERKCCCTCTYALSRLPTYVTYSTIVVESGRQHGSTLHADAVLSLSRPPSCTTSTRAGQACAATATGTGRSLDREVVVVSSGRPVQGQRGQRTTSTALLLNMVFTSFRAHPMPIARPASGVSWLSRLARGMPSLPVALARQEQPPADDA